MNGRNVFLTEEELEKLLNLYDEEEEKPTNSEESEEQVDPSN